MDNTNNIINKNAYHDLIWTEEDRGAFLKRLSAELPSYFRLYARLLWVADPIGHDINCSIRELAKVINYDYYNLWLILTCLNGMNIIELSPLNYSQDVDEKVRIRILVLP